MSLSADEKLRVAHAPRRPRHPFHRGRLPQLQPEGGGALRAARAASSFENSTDLRLRHDPPPRRRGRPTIRRCAAGELLRAGLHARRQDLEAAPREGDPHRPDENLALIADSVAFLRAAGQARDLRRRALLRRLPRRRRLRAALPRRGARGRRRERRRCATPTAPACRRQVAEATRARRARASAASGSASTRTTTPSAAVANSIAAVEEGASARAGHHERRRRALRQRQPGLDPARRSS